MENFSYFFGISVGELVSTHGDNLSKALQNESITAAERQRLASLTVTTLQKFVMQNNLTCFGSWLQKKHLLLMYPSQHFQENEKHPKIWNRHWRISFPWRSRRILLSNSLWRVGSSYHLCERKVWSTWLLVTECLLLKAVCGEDFTAELESASSFYVDDFSVSTLQVQLQTLRTQFENESHTTLRDIVQYLKTFNDREITIYSEVVTLLKVIRQTVLVREHFLQWGG